MAKKLPHCHLLNSCHLSLLFSRRGSRRRFTSYCSRACFLSNSSCSNCCIATCRACSFIILWFSNSCFSASVIWMVCCCSKCHFSSSALLEDSSSRSLERVYRNCAHFGKKHTQGLMHNCYPLSRWATVDNQATVSLGQVEFTHIHTFQKWNHLPDQTLHFH